MGEKIKNWTYGNIYWTCYIGTGRNILEMMPKLDPKKRYEISLAEIVEVKDNAQPEGGE